MKNSFHYTIYWQAKNSNDISKEKELFSALSNFFASDLVQAATTMEKSNAEYLQKQTQILRGGLSPFLSTVLQSDTTEINKIINDALKSINLLVSPPRLISASLLIINSTELPLHKKRVNAIKPLLIKGKKELQERGIRFSKNSARVFTTTFFVDEIDSIQIIRNIISHFREENNEQFIPVCSSLSKILQQIDSPAIKRSFNVTLSLSSSAKINDAALKIKLLLANAPISNVTVQSPQPFSVSEHSPQLTFGLDLDKFPLGKLLEDLELFSDSKENLIESLIISNEIL